MTRLDAHLPSGDENWHDDDGVETRTLDLYEAGGDEGSGFHVFNLASNHFHRAEVLQRTGAINVICKLEKVAHGAMSAESDRYATLLVMQWIFQPKNTRRISEATIELLFHAGPGGGEVEVESISFDGTYGLMPTTQQEGTVIGGQTSIGVSNMVGINMGVKWEKRVNKDITNFMKLQGGKFLMKNKPPNCIARWTLSENESQPAGIPASLRVAILVSREDQKMFYCKFAFTCKTDMKTALESCFKKIPKDDPIIFQPDSDEKGIRPHKNATYDDDELGSADVEKLGDVTFNTIITDAQKTR